ncbi:hypothetical protein [Mesorhizobium sp. WSM4884]|uniref:hypothetical protein n=1 Tax=Mesorhizobium sp. WSM4884 TaxID=3038542 RepID=UPI0024162E26|nr:hypothetical protein [Mesorhizobium sp. WSM4884]MDG4883049.1 hypothetical protein [Mesorhizobium sp. WSM4884]
MPRPKQVPTRRPLSEEEIEAASYVGSKEHKVKRWWGGLPGAWEDQSGNASRPKKEHTTVCRKITAEEREEASRWVRTALREGQYRFFDGDKIYPKYIWYRDQLGQHWFGFAVNQVAGTYKGWPISEAEKNETFD